MLSKDLKRFLAKVRLDDGVRCWEWLAHRDRAGYGRFQLGSSRLAHRVAYEHFVSLVPGGLELDHFRCDNRGCVNPTHVRPVSRRENVLRSNAPSAWNAARTNCPKGHPYAGNNLYVAANGNRVCKTCRAVFDRHRYRITPR